MIKFLKYVPVQLTFFLIIGILIGSFFTIKPFPLVLMASVITITFSIIHFYSNKLINQSLFYAVLVALISLFIGVSSITFKNNLNEKNHYANLSNFKTNENTLATLSIIKVLKATNYYDKYEAEIIQVETTKSIGKILLNINKDSIFPKLKVDEKIVVNASILELNKPLNPYTFNYKNYLEKQQIHHQIYIRNNQFLKLPNTRSTLIGIAANFRDKINYSLKKYGFNNDELAVVNALLLGQRQRISSDLLESYSSAGAIHILAVSGLHIGIILLILNFLFKPLLYFKNGKFIAGFLIICLLWSYAIVASLSASVVRAVTMFTAITIGMYANRPTNIYYTLVISMFFLLLFNPYYLFEVGFQLSYLAVFAIVWIQPKLNNLITPKFWLINKMWQLLTVSLAAQIGVLPLSIYYFHQFPGLFFVSNLVIIPFLGFILTVGIIVISLSLISQLPQVLADLFMFIIKQMNHFVDWIANQHVFIIKDISLSVFLMVAIYSFIFLFIKWTEKKQYYRLVLFLVSFLAIQSTLIFEKYKRESTNEIIVFNDYKTSILAKRLGSELTVYSSKDSLINNYAIESYLIGTGLKNNLKSKNSDNLYMFKNETILVVDSLGIYNFSTVKPTIILLQKSPKINLERLLKIHQPRILIADASNYKSYLENWERTCYKNKTPFYNTMQKGAFILKD
ncbi:ComEC/Rec2 family competence protein [Lutibacter flavus]|uniref:Competence protein ComEC n=1 Tax=Lutibacter flavus TaxID=691689 RepID=A0A238Z0D6_9FLAO|nr:ComEC/Rec2 family competence protein [Lutibacter flavus]SNR76388.1 competence protein ComEC [Lutibacter flavus]